VGAVRAIRTPALDGLRINLYALRMHIIPRHRLTRPAVVAIAAGAVLAGCGSGSSHDSGSRTLQHGPAGAVFTGVSAPTVVVPRLVGRRQEDAHRLVDRAGLKLRWTGFTGKLGNGRYNVSCVKILSQSPVAGERRPRGASIAVIETACHTPTMKPYSMFHEEPKR
jgi:hypothetical protein